MRIGFSDPPRLIVTGQGASAGGMASRVDRRTLPMLMLIPSWDRMTRSCALTSTVVLKETRMNSLFSVGPEVMETPLTRSGVKYNSSLLSESIACFYFPMNYPAPACSAAGLTGNLSKQSSGFV
jgi:hypothetical protein